MITWEYIAGFFDGEGCVMGHNKTPRISIAQKRPQVLVEIQDFLYEHDIRSQIFTYSTKDISQLRINARLEVISFIDGVLPHLIVKKEECEQALGKLSSCKIRTKWRLSELKKMKDLRTQGMTAKQISILLGRSLRTVEAYCYKDGRNGVRFEKIGFTNKL